MQHVLVPHAIGGASIGPFGATRLVRTLSGRTMGTTWHATLVVADDRSLPRHRAAIEALLASLVDDLSNWEPASALSRFNAAAVGTWQSLPASLIDVLEASRALHVASDGAFDPTVAPHVMRWGFGPPADRDGPVTTGFDVVEIDAGAARACRHADVALDLCGIAKGYAVDRVSRLLTDTGVPHHLVEIGGELRGAGVKPDGMPWWVALEDPPDAPPDASPNAVVPTIAALHGLSVATSGDYRRFVEVDGRRLTHTIDPRTGCPVRDAPAAVSVLHADCMRADGEATAITVLGAVAGLAYATARGLAARIVSRRAAGRLVAVRTPAFDALLA